MWREESKVCCVDGTRPREDWVETPSVRSQDKSDDLIFEIKNFDEEIKQRRSSRHRQHETCNEAFILREIMLTRSYVSTCKNFSDSFRLTISLALKIQNNVQASATVNTCMSIGWVSYSVSCDDLTFSVFSRTTSASWIQALCSKDPLWTLFVIGSFINVVITCCVFPPLPPSLSVNVTFASYPNNRYPRSSISLSTSSDVPKRDTKRWIGMFVTGHR